MYGYPYYPYFRTPTYSLNNGYPIAPQNQLDQGRNARNRSSANRQTPNPTILMNSANIAQNLLNDANLVLERLSNDANFTSQIMSAARESNFDEVNRLISEVGVGTAVVSWFNPDFIRFELRSDQRDIHGSLIAVQLLWQVPPYM